MFRAHATRIPILRRCAEHSRFKSTQDMRDDNLIVRIAGTCKSLRHMHSACSPLQTRIICHGNHQRLANELHLFGRSVGCVVGQCSACLCWPGDCQCGAWTCRCEECVAMRILYRSKKSYVTAGCRMMKDEYDPLQSDVEHDEHVRRLETRVKRVDAELSRRVLEIFIEYSVENTRVRMQRDMARMKEELDLYGNAVGCLSKRCSFCNHNSSSCNCIPWTCRCYDCWRTRIVYKRCFEGRGYQFKLVDDGECCVEHESRRRADAGRLMEVHSAQFSSLISKMAQWICAIS